MLLALALGGCPGTWESTSTSDLEQSYENEFETKPPPSVKVLKSRIAVYRGSGHHWLRLQVEPSALAPVILSRGFKKSDATSFNSQSKHGDMPKWWPEMSPDAFDFYENSEWTKGSWRMSSAALAVQRAGGQIYFYGYRVD